MNVVLDGRYRIIKKIGRGGFSQTYLAQNLALPEMPACVIKHLKPQVQHPQNLQLFQAEARVLDRLNHQQIPSSTDCFEQNGEVFLVQDFIDGRDLGKEYLRGRQWLESEMRGFLRDLLEILKYVHQHHIIHRDIKPDNIIQRKDNGKFVLIDFGAVHELDKPTTAHPVVVGTAGYRSPEQIRGEACFGIDIYSLGVTAIQLLTLTHPQYLKMTIDHKLVWQERTMISTDLARIIDRMTCPQVADRYQSAAEVLVDLDSLPITTTQTLIQPENRPPNNQPFPKRFQLLVGALIGCSLLGTCGSIYLNSATNNSPAINQIQH
jgi:eukaryotic-like serine/threonine-protein kinase